MTREEVVYELFGREQEKKIDWYIPEIREKFSHQTEKLTIDVKEVDEEDIKKKRDNREYLSDELLQFTENGIRIIHATEAMSEQLKEYIPTSVKELTIPSTFLTDISFLQSFPNLETLCISDYSTFSPEEIEYIEKNTSVKNMILRSGGTFNKIRCKEGYNIVEAGNIIGQYKKLTLYNKGYTGKWGRNLKIYIPNYNEENLEIIETLCKGIKSRLEDVKSVSISDDVLTADFSIDNIEDKKAKKLSISRVEPSVAARVYNHINNNIEVETTEYLVENKTYEDIDKLRKIDKTTSLKMKYPSGDSKTNATYDEFIGMRATIDYYKEILENLSPAEKVACVYDILKTMKYNEHKSDKLRSRNIHSIVADGNIVCVGYSNFAQQLLKEVGVKSISTATTCLRQNGPDEYHQRNFVRIDDDKYNIHGLYAMDITWDSDKEVALIENQDGEKSIISRPTEDQKAQVVDQYDSLVLYRYFLTPFELYEQRFPNEENPKIYEVYKNGKARNLIDESRKIASGKMKRYESKNSVIIDQHHQLFDIAEGPLTVEKYVSAKKPSLETFEEIVKNVRIAQGYSEEEAEKDTERVVELHQMLASQNPNSPSTFFQSKAK